MRVTVVVQTATKIFNGLKAQNERVLLRSAARSFYTSTLSKSKLINEPISSLQPSISSLHLLCSLSDDEKRSNNSTSSQPLLLSSIWNKQQYQQRLHPHGSSLILGKAYYSRRVTGSSSQRRVQYKERENETEQAQVVDDQIQKQEQQQSSNDYESDMKQHEALTPGSIQHMRKVYSTMFASSAIATSGALIGMATGFMTPLLGLAAIVPLIALERTDLNSSPTVRMGLASAFSFLSGMGIAPLIKYAFIVNPVAIPFSLAVTTGIFGAMTFASLVTKKGSFLKMGVPLFGATIGLMLLGLGSFFVPASSIFYPLVTSGFSYLGVGLFSLFIAYDNQRILSEYEQGERDTLKHGLSMFINIKNLFSFLLSIFSSSRD